MSLGTGLGLAAELDRSDPLAKFRGEFAIPKRPDGEDEIYLCGNSLGLLPLRSARYVQEEIEKWKKYAVRAHFEPDHPWMPYHAFLRDPMSAIVGALPSEVVVMNSLTTNLHLMMVSFYRPSPERHKILVESQTFPSDRYAVESQIRFHGFDPETSLLIVEPRPGEETIRDDDLLETITREGETIALVLLPGVQYYTGQRFDLEQIARVAREKGCAVGFDLAHAAGNVILNLHDWNVDFAVWCTYKYLNSGPGSVGGCFIHERHVKRRDLPRFAGWWGHDEATRFQMGPDFHPMPTAEGWQLSNPPILSLAAIRGSVEIFIEAGGMSALRAKSVELTRYLEELIRSNLESAITIVTPHEAERRGCQLSLRVSVTNIRGRELFEKLEAAGVMCDWREPDVIRVAPAPLYNSFSDVLGFVEAVKSVTG